MAQNSYDVVIVGGGVAGMRTALQCAEKGLTYKVIEANSYLGGRILSQKLDLSSYKAHYPHLPDTYLFEHGAGWIHGVEGNPLVDIFKELFEKYEPGQKFEDQLSAMFPGNAWYMPEFAKYEHFTLIDGKTLRQMTKAEHNQYLVIVCVHLREIFRNFNGLQLSKFSQLYVDWLSTTLAANPQTADAAELLARAVGWYFHSIEAYSGTPKGVMSASDIFVAQDTAEPLSEDVDYDIANDILTPASTQRLYELVNSASTFNVDEMLAKYLTTPHAMGDAALQGCYLSDHSTLKCGMLKLIELFKKDTEYRSGQEFSVDLFTKVNRIEFPDNVAHEKVMVTALPEDLTINVDAEIVEHAENESSEDDADIQDKVNAILHATNVNTQEQITYYARHAVVCTASVYSLVDNIQFPQDKPQLNNIKQIIDDTSSPVFYKKVLFCFPHMWWGHKEKSRLFALTQHVTNFAENKCTHARCAAQIAHLSEEDYHSLDHSQGGYPCIIQMGKDLVNGHTTIGTPQKASLLRVTKINDEDEDDEEEEQDEISQDSEVDFCGVNMIWESHIYNKNIPVLSASIVGNFAEKLANVDDDIVKMIVFKQLSKIYKSTAMLQHQNGNTDFPTTIPEPLWSRVTHWAENDTILQSYSLITDCQYTTEERITLAADNHIYLAGEALHLEHGGSVHGAIFSADYALEQIVEKYIQ